MDRFAIRRIRLQELVDEAGSQAKLADLIGKQPDYISRALKDGTKGAKRIGETLAEEIEKKCGKPKGWMSTLDDADAPEWPFGFDRKLWDSLPAEERATIAIQFRRMVLSASSEHQARTTKRRTG